MSCVLTAAIAAQCRDAVGGISKVWAVEVSSVGEYTEVSGAITGFSSLLQVVICMLGTLVRIVHL